MKIEQVDRYRSCTIFPGDDREPYGSMMKHERGGYVRYEDYQALLQKMSSIVPEGCVVVRKDLLERSKQVFDSALMSGGIERGHYDLWHKLVESQRAKESSKEPDEYAWLRGYSGGES